MLFPKFLEKDLGGGAKKYLLLENQFFLTSFRILGYFQHFKKNKGNIEKCHFTCWLNGEVISPNSRYRAF